MILNRSIKYNIFVADLPAAIKSKLRQYADDCSLSKEIKSEEDSAELQKDMDGAELWCANNGMKKCKVYIVRLLIRQYELN
jgi:hypothetical protein